MRTGKLIFLAFISLIVFCQSAVAQGYNVLNDENGRPYGFAPIDPPDGSPFFAYWIRRNQEGQLSEVAETEIINGETVVTRRWVPKVISPAGVIQSWEVISWVGEGAGSFPLLGFYLTSGGDISRLPERFDHTGLFAGAELPLSSPFDDLSYSSDPSQPSQAVQYDNSDSAAWGMANEVAYWTVKRGDQFVLKTKQLGAGLYSLGSLMSSYGRVYLPGGVASVQDQMRVKDFGGLLGLVNFKRNLIDPFTESVDAFLWDVYQDPWSVDKWGDRSLDLSFHSAMAAAGSGAVGYNPVLSSPALAMAEGWNALGPLPLPFSNPRVREISLPLVNSHLEFPREIKTGAKITGGNLASREAGSLEGRLMPGVLPDDTPVIFIRTEIGEAFRGGTPAKDPFYLSWYLDLLNERTGHLFPRNHGIWEIEGQVFLAVEKFDKSAALVSHTNNHNFPFNWLGVFDRELAPQIAQRLNVPLVTAKQFGDFGFYFDSGLRLRFDQIRNEGGMVWNTLENSGMLRAYAVEQRLARQGLLAPEPALSPIRSPTIDRHFGITVTPSQLPDLLGQ